MLTLCLIAPLFFMTLPLKKIVPLKYSLGYKIFTCPKNGAVKLFERYLILDGKVRKKQWCNVKLLVPFWKGLILYISQSIPNILRWSRIFPTLYIFNLKVWYLLINSQNFSPRTQFQFISRSWQLIINLWYCSCGESGPLKPQLCLKIIRASNPFIYLTMHSYHTCSLFISVGTGRILKFCTLSLIIIGRRQIMPSRNSSTFQVRGT